jgi:3-methyladenine DNA glycosylase AlkC
MAETKPFKEYFGLELAERLGAELRAADPEFDRDAFVAQVAAQVESLELKDRVALIAAALHDHLPPDYPQALARLLTLLGPELPDESGMFELGYHLMPVAQFVEQYGLDDFEQSMAALYEITKRHTAEFAIRPFLERHPTQTLDTLSLWAGDPNPHVRRLVSEGTRPRLPWAGRLSAFIVDPGPVLSLLERLKTDPSAYVRKSVANNLNDISKDNPDVVLATLRDWNARPSADIRWITSHALRTLVKQGNSEALALLGFEPPRVRLAQLNVTPETVRIGEAARFTFALHSDSEQPQKLLVDYLLHFASANGKPRAKVFKLKQLTLPAGQHVDLEKTHSFKQVTVRRYYPGRHRVEIQINGHIAGGTDFMVVGD